MADRWDRRRLQIRALVAMTGIVATLLGLAFMHRLDVWALFLATALGGIVWACVQPAQQSLPADLLSGRDLVNGIALLNTAINLTAILGPALGGALLACCRRGSPPTAGAAAGVQWAYGVLLLLYLVQLGNYWAIRLEPRPPMVAAPRSGSTSWRACAIAAVRPGCGPPWRSLAWSISWPSPCSLAAAVSWGCARSPWRPCCSAAHWLGLPPPALARRSQRWAAPSLVCSSLAGSPPGFHAASRPEA
jgi:MFS family permease